MVPLATGGCFYQGSGANAHPMGGDGRVVGALSAFYHYALDIGNPQAPHHLAFRLIARCRPSCSHVRTVTRWTPFIYPPTTVYTATHSMMFAVPPRMTR